MTSLPHWQLDAKQTGALPHMVLVTAIDEASEQATIYDYAARPFQLSMADLASARARLRKAKHRLARVSAGASIADLPDAIRAGLHACVRSLQGEPPAKAMINNWGLRGIDKWASLANDPRNKKGWAKQFSRGAALFAGLRQGYFWIETSGTGGGGFRPLYAAFLNEAAGVLGAGALTELAARYTQLGTMWTELAHAMLPGDVPLLAETRALLELKRDALHERGPDASAEIAAANTRLDEIAAEAAQAFPLDEATTADLYADLATRVRAIYDAEMSAAEALAAAAAGV